MQLPLIQTSIRELQMLESQWKAAIDPVLGNPIVSGSQLTGIQLTTGVNVINTLLGRTAQGWILTDINAAVTVYRSAPFNGLTLTLTSSGSCIVNILIF